MPITTKEWIYAWSAARPMAEARHEPRAARPPVEGPAEPFEHTHGWHDSSFDLRQGLDVIELHHDRWETDP